MTEGSGTGKTVLVVEDNELNLELVRDVLEFNGYLVRQARTGQEGIDAARAEALDLILMDLQLPDMDGREVLAEIRALGVSREMTPSVAVTAFAMKGDEERFLAAGFDGYIAKPIDVTTFADEIQRYCVAER
jgi:two-component system cell cycle response regulator DivK